MKKFIVILVAVVGLGLSANAQKAYNTEDALVQGVLQIVNNMPNTSKTQWVELFLPSFKLAKSLDTEAMNTKFTGSGMSEREFNDFINEWYSNYKKSYNGRDLERTVYNKVTFEQFIKRPDRGFVGKNITGHHLKIYFKEGGSMEVTYFEYKGKYYLLCLS